MSNPQIEVDEQNQSARKELYEAYSNPTLKTRRNKKLIESLDEIYGYDLAFVIGLIMKSEFSGNLNIISQSNELSGISFSKGRITKIDSNDKDTFMGELLIKEGFLSREKLLGLLKDQTKPLGETLISNKIVTKEQIIEILIKQMRLRLSKYITATKYRLNFSESEVEDFGLSISYTEYLGLAHDWVAGRFDPEWLKLHYVEMSESIIDVLNTSNINLSAHANLPLIKDLKTNLSQFNDQILFSALVNSSKNDKDPTYFYKYFHYGVMIGLIALKENPNSGSNNDSILKNIYSVCSKKTGVELVETLANILKFKPTEIDAIFQSINNYVMLYSGEDQDMKNNMFRIVLEMLSKKQYYEEQMNKKYSQSNSTEGQIDHSKKMDEIFKDLINKNLYLAVDKLKKLSALNTPIPKLKLYLVWGKALLIHQNNVTINLSEIERDFLQILPEDKDSAEYYYVRSILLVLKKDLVGAENCYQRAIRLKGEFKNYPPFEKKESFIKKIFKFSIILFMLITSSHLNLKAQSSIVTPKKIPFVYLNQYFEYLVTGNGDTKINEQQISFSDFELIQKEVQIKIKLKSDLDKKLNIQFSTFNLENKKYTPIKFIKKIENNENYLQITSKKISTNDLFCLIRKNAFSQLKICKPLIQQSGINLKSVQLNDQIIQNEGQIILNDASQKAEFKIELQDNSFLSLTTLKRSILPLEISKEVNAEDIEFQFIDKNNSSVAWKEKININQNHFDLRFDDILILKQGIFFNSAVNTQASFVEKYADRDTIFKKYYNKIFIEPLFIFDELRGKSEEVEARINSGTGIGLGLSYDRYLESNRNLFGQFGFYSTKLTSNLGTAITNESKLNMIFLIGGYKIPLTNNWSISAVGKLQEYTFFNKALGNQVDITKSFVLAPGLNTEYELLKFSKLSIDTGLNLYLSLPNDVPNTSKTEIGTMASIDLKSSYKVSWGKITGSIQWEERKTKNSVYTYNSSTVIYRIGTNYLF